MMRRICTFGIWTFALGVIALWSGATAAQTYPTRPVRVIVTTPAGGATDIIARAVTQRLADIWGQQIIVENKPGANTQIGAEAAAKSTPDGYTLLATSETTLSVNPFLYRNLAYDTKDFTPVSGMGLINQVLIVHPSVAAQNVADLIRLAKARPRELNYGTLGIGSSSHLNTLMFESMAGVQLAPVHYKGGAPALTDLIGGHIPLLFISVTLMHQPWKAGQVRALGVGTSARLAQFPELPTIAESGLPGYQAVSWFGLFAQSAVPRHIVVKINADVQRVLLDPEFKQRFLDPNYYEPIPGSPEQFADYVNAAAAKWRRVITEAKLSIE
jgi:tripartite-type tricarboxylate transporter receptor subunit TctC